MIMVVIKNIDTCLLVGTFQVVITIALFTKLKQIIRLSSKRKLLSRKLFKIRQMNIEILQMTNSTDHTYGVMMFLFLLVNYPTNAYLVMILIKKQMSILNNIIFITIISYQLSFIFIFHFITTQYAHQLHRPAKYVVRNYLNPSLLLISLNNRMKVSFWIENFHTKKMYGITYGGIEVITLKTFFKVFFYEM